MKKYKEQSSKQYTPIKRWLPASVLLLFILMLNTYLSKLSLTADFDGKDFGRIERLQVCLNSLKSDPVSKTTISSTLQKLILDTLQTEVIIRDFEFAGHKPDSAFNHFMQSVITDTLTRRRDVVDSLNINYLNEMKELRDRGMSAFILFWPKYLIKVAIFAYEKGPISLWMNILVSPLLYLVIFIFAVVMTKKVLKRMAERYDTLKFTEEIDKILQSHYNETVQADKFETIIRKFKYRTVGVGAMQFVEQLKDKEIKKISHTSFDLILLADDNETEHFTRTTDFINTWILRLGILGTLLGIMLAFYEVAKAVPLIQAGNIPPAFKQKIREALTGHAVSVITALAAQMTSILYEFCSLESAGISLSKDWLIKCGEKYIDDTKAITCDMKALCYQLSETLGGTIAEISKNFKALNASAANLPSMTDEISRNLKCINDNLKATKESSDEITENVNDSLATIILIKQFLAAIKNRLDDLRQKFETKIGRFFEWLKSIMESVKKGI